MLWIYNKYLVTSNILVVCDQKNNSNAQNSIYIRVFIFLKYSHIYFSRRVNCLIEYLFFQKILFFNFNSKSCLNFLEDFHSRTGVEVISVFKIAKNHFLKYISGIFNWIQTWRLSRSVYNRDLTFL